MEQEKQAKNRKITTIKIDIETKQRLDKLKEHDKEVIVAYSDESGRGNVYQSSTTRI